MSDALGAESVSGPFDVAGGFYIGDDVEVSDVPGLPPPVYGRVFGRDIDTFVKVMLDNGCGYITRAENLTRVAPRPLAEPTPRTKKGMWREKGDTILSESIYLLGHFLMESLNGVLCQYEDDRCSRCAGLWADLDALIKRYDEGER